MARGLVSGLAAGSVVAVLGLGGLSLVMPLPQSPAPGLQNSGLQSSGLQDPGQPAPAGQPATAPATSPATSPSAGPATAIPLPEGSEFARTGADATPAPAQEALPAGEAKAAPAAPAPDPVPEAATPGTEPPARPTLDATPPLAPAPPQTAAAALEAAPEAEPAMPVPPPGEAEAPLLPRAEGEAPPPGAEITLLPDGALLPPDPNLPRSAAPDAAPETAPQAPARVGFADAQGTKVNRLPQVGAAAAPGAEKPGFKRPPGAETAPETVPEAATPEAATPAPAPAAEAGAEGGALARFAAPFTAQPGKPLFAVVLIDVGTAAGGLDRETIAALGPSVTVALSPARPGAAEDAAFYRAAGLEVTILADALPAGATAQDLEVSFADWHRTLPQAIALVEPPEPRVQTASKLVTQAVKALGAEGMAYVPQELGMASALQIAASAELPRASIWRVLDARRDKAPVVTRTLSRAAFEAARDGKLVVMISAWPESVAGLNAWRAEAAAALNLAPLSTVALQSLAP